MKIQVCCCILLFIICCVRQSKAQSTSTTMRLDSIDFATYHSSSSGVYKWKSKYIFSYSQDTLFAIKKTNANVGFKIDYTKIFVLDKRDKWVNTYTGNGHIDRFKYFTNENGILIKQTAGHGKSRKEIEYHYLGKVLDELKISYENGQEFYKEVKSDEFGRIIELGCKKIKGMKVDTCLSDRTYYFTYNEQKQALPSTIIVREKQESFVNKYDFKYDQDGNITYKKWYIENNNTDSIRVVSESFIKFNDSGFKHSSISESNIHRASPEKNKTEFTYDNQGNLTFFETTTEYGSLKRRKIIFEYYPNNGVPMNNVYGEILSSNLSKFSHQTCSTFSYACMHELVDQFSPRPILKRTPSRIREYIKVAEPNDWNLVSEHIFHFSTVN